MPKHRVVSIQGFLSAAVMCLALAVPLAAQGPDARQVPPAISVTLQEPERPAPTTSQRLLASAEHVPVILLWCGVAGGLALVMWGIRRVITAFPRRDFTHILFEDLSATREERLDRNRLLAQSVINRLQNAQPLDTFDLQMDVMPGAAEPGFGGLQPVLTMASVLEYERTDHPITVGAIEFSLRDVLTMVSRFFTRPPEQYLEGWLIEGKDGVVEVGAHMLTHRRQPKPRPRRQGWEGRPQDPSADSQPGKAPPLAWVVRGIHGRERAIADLAAQILVDMGRSTLTSDWRSLRSFHEAMALRDDQRFDTRSPHASGSVQDRLSTTRSHLTEAVSYDPSNWIARFSLAVTLCRDGEPQLALEHLKILERAVARAWPCVPKDWLAKPRSKRNWPPDSLTNALDDADGPGFKELVRHLALLPECAFLVLFNKGIAYATQKDDYARLCDARDIFRRLSDWMPPESSCTTSSEPDVAFDSPYDLIAEHVRPSRRTTLALYAMGAQATLIAETHESVAGQRLEDRPIPALQALLQQIHAHCYVRDAAHWPSAMSARAITHAALGHVFFTSKQIDQARENFETALASEPRLVRALLGLTETYLEHAKRALLLPSCDRAHTREWLARADALLDRAMAINASCEQGARLRKQVEMYRGVEASLTGSDGGFPGLAVLLE